MYYIALRMLFGDRAKYMLLLAALAFASLLITQQASVFCGIMRWSTATLRNSYAPIWVVDPKVEQCNESNPLRDIDLMRVRSIDGVKWAMPVSYAPIEAHLRYGEFKTIMLFGLDASTLAGGPKEMVQGRLEDLLGTQTVVVDEFGIERLSEGSPRKLQVGDSFQINDIEARIVGICKTERSFFNYPFVYTTYPHAKRFRPPQRKELSAVIAEPQEGQNAKEVALKIEQITTLRAYTDDEFFWSTIWWMFKNTGIPVSVGTTVILGFIVGIAVSGQTFYSFVLENLPHFGIMKAMGASNRMLYSMMLVQALTVGLIGYGLGLGFATIFGWAVYVRGTPPFFLTLELMALVLVAILIICAFAVILGVRRISKLEPTEVFRG